MTPEVQASRRAALELLCASKRIILTGHQRPDGDCIGAQAALSRILQKMGKDVWIYNPDPVEPQFDYLSREVDFRTYKTDTLPVHDLVVLLDCSDLSRCGSLESILRAAPSKKLVIDHHIHVGAEWWDEAYTDVTASATGLLIGRIARELEIELDPVACEGIFTSIVTDTGWFKYSNTDAETLIMAGELVAGGVRAADLYGSIYQRHSKGHPPAIGKALERLEYFADGRLAVVDLPFEAGRDAHMDSDDLLDLVRSVQAVEVVLFLRELEDGTCKLSARSKTDYDVNRLARQFGGGGHAKASGATLTGKLADLRSRLVEAAVAGFQDA